MELPNETVERLAQMRIAYLILEWRATHEPNLDQLVKNILNVLKDEFNYTLPK